MSQYEVDFNIESFGKDENDIQYLKTAIENLSNESEKQFQNIKDEKWFTRIIDLATLSNKKNIRMSQQISNIAQAQDILIELLKRLSATDVKIDNMLLNSMNQIEQLYNHTEKLALKVTDLKEQMIYGINQSKNINDLKDIEKKCCIVCFKRLLKLLKIQVQNNNNLQIICLGIYKLSILALI